MHPTLTTESLLSELAAAHRVSARHAHMLASNELLCRSGSIEVIGARAEIRLSAGARALIQAGAGEGPGALRAALRAVHADDRGRVIAQWRRAQPGKPFELRHRLLRADGSVLRVLQRGLMEIVDGEACPKPVAILQDITEQSAAQDRIERLVNYHPVTGLATRTLLLERAAGAVERAQRENRPVAMLFLRVAEVDRVHDALGLNAGDALAATLAERLLDDCRGEDTAAHLGSGEFAILLDPCAGADESQALNTATKLLATLAAPAAVGQAELITEGQVGIAMFPSDSSDAAELLAHAHAACGRGGAGISFFTREAGVSAARRIRLETALRRAFERNGFELHYQPQVDLRSGAVIGAEALLRWRCDEFGAVSPAEFVPIAEEIGLIVPLGEWVFRSACLQSVAWQRAGLPSVRIGVNLSPRQLEEADISQRLQAILLDTGADPNRLGVEVTESVLMRDFDHARRTLQELSAIGVEIALDDFGTGYSNLGALGALPFDVLKIDRSLVHDVTAAPEDVSITRAVLMLAQGLKLKVLAEGVETEGQLNLLIANGCELMQGYIFSKPLPAAVFEQMLRDGARLPEQLLHRAGRPRTLLLVDDEDGVLASLRRMLRGAGYHIVTARHAEEALARLAESDIDVIVSDQGMPGMSGVELMHRVSALYPDTVRMILSGYGELQAITDALNDGAIHKFLTKPWDDERLREHIADAFRRKELADENRRLTHEVRGANRELARANQHQALMLAQQREQLSLEEVRALNAQDLLEHLPTAILGVDAQGTIAFVNRQARALMRGAPSLVGCDAAAVLPADWLRALRRADGRHHRGLVDGRPCLLSCGPMSDRGKQRGHLLSVIPVPDACQEVLA
ncbi:MAG TPA: EAL domain-containing protein [Burkholderiaceae bacterium]|jgi:diguanylate cyclase (GGDEF)-like protein